MNKNTLLSVAVEIDLLIVYKLKSFFLFHQNKIFDVKVNSIADE